MSAWIYLEIPVRKVCEHCGSTYNGKEPVFESNITYNLYEMAKAARIDNHIFEPKKIGILQAKDLIIPLQYCLQDLKTNSESYKKFNPPNGWGSYESFVQFIETYLNTCETYLEASITVNG